MTETTPDPIAEQLSEWRERFTNRRTVPWEMLELAESMIRTAADTHRRRYSCAIEVLEDQHTREIERLRAEHEMRLGVLQRTVEAQRDTIGKKDRMLTERRSLREARQAAGEDDVEVTICSDDYFQGWRLSDLEEIAYRFRCGGATDDTPVEMGKNRAVAVVPAPNLVTLRSEAGGAPRSPSPVPETTKDPTESFTDAFPTHVRYGIVVLGTSLVFALIILAFGPLPW